MASIALKKPSGGQLILSPEDGTSTETVTIPSIASDGKLAVDSGHFMYAKGAVNYATYHNAWAKLDIFSNVISDPRGEFTNAQRYTPTKAGYYDVYAQIHADSITTGAGTIGYNLQIRKNGVLSAQVEQIIRSNPDGAAESVSTNGMYYMNGTTDYLEVWIYQNDSNLRYIIGSYTAFKAVWVGE